MNKKQRTRYITDHEKCIVENEEGYGYKPIIAGYKMKYFDAPWITVTMCKPCGRRQMHVELQDDDGTANEVWAFTAQSNASFWFGQECEWCLAKIPVIYPHDAKVVVTDSWHAARRYS